MNTARKQNRAPMWLMACGLLFHSCSSTQQGDQQEEVNANTANNASTAENSEDSQGNNYGNTTANVNDELNQFNAENGNTKNNTAAKADADDAELINSAPLNLGETEPSTTTAANVAGANVTPPQAAIPAAVDAGRAATTSVAEIESERGALWWIAYDFQRKEKVVRVQMLTKGRPQFDILYEQNKAKQQEIIVRFYNSTMRPKMRRSMDATEFRSPVVFIRTREDLSIPSVDVILTLREPVKPQLFAKRGNVQLTFPVDAKYFATNKRIDHPEYVAQNIEVKAVSLTPDLAEGSELPRSTLTKVYVPNPVGETFTGETDRPADPALLKPETGIPGNVDPKGLPVSDYVNPDPSPANTTAPPSNTNPEVTIPTQGYWPGMEAFSLLAVAQENFSLSNSAARPAGDEFSAPNASPEQLDLGGDSNDATGNTPAIGDSTAPATEVLSEASLPAANADVTAADMSGGVTYTGKPVALEFYNTPLGEVLKAFSEQIGTNFIYSPEIARLSVTIKLKNVPWDAALDAIMQTYQLGMAKLSDNVIRIDRTDAMTQFLVAKDRTEQAKILSEPRKVVVIRLSNARADAAFSARLTSFFQLTGVDNRTSVNVDPRTNTVFIEAPPFILQRAKALIEKLDVPEPQVEVVSRLIEVSRQARNFMGISWNGGLNFDAGRGLSGGSLNFPNNMNSNFSVDPGVNGTDRTGAINFNLGSLNDAIDLGLRLKMEESKGTAEILQSNRVIVADRENANISAGQTAYYRVAQSPIFVQSTQQQGSAAGGSAAASSGLTSANFSLSLQVRPEVTNDGHVRMDLRISSEVPSPQALPGSDISTNRRELSTILKKRSGETAVIGGIYDTRKSEQEYGIPFLSRLPIIGALFRSKSKSEDQTELMMMITPSIVGKDGEPLPDTAAYTPTNSASNASLNAPNNAIQENTSALNQSQENANNSNSLQENNSMQANSEEAL